MEFHNNCDELDHLSEKGGLVRIITYFLGV
jgi:hypothetical protein